MTWQDPPPDRILPSLRSLRWTAIHEAASAEPEPRARVIRRALDLHRGQVQLPNLRGWGLGPRESAAPYLLLLFDDRLVLLHCQDGSPGMQAWYAEQYDLAPLELSARPDGTDRVAELVIGGVTRLTDLGPTDAVGSLLAAAERLSWLRVRSCATSDEQTAASIGHASSARYEATGLRSAPNPRSDTATAPRERLRENLRTLQSLLDEGLISAGEFTQRKSALLDRRVVSDGGWVRRPTPSYEGDERTVPLAGSTSNRGSSDVSVGALSC